MYDEVLFPYDGSEGAATALEHVAAIAQWADGEIRLLYVADTTHHSVTRVGSTVVDGLVGQGEEILSSAVDTVESMGVTASTDVVQGSPAETIVEYATEYEYDVIAMPTQGRQGVSRYLLGSVTEKVVRLAETPVLTVRMDPDQDLTFPYERVLVATDGSAPAEYAAAHGLELAANLDATAHVLSTVDTASFGPDVRSETLSTAGEAAAEEAVETVANEAQRRGFGEVVRHVEHGSPAGQILDCVDRLDIDVVVMGTTGRQGLTRILLGSVAEKTVRSSPVPVLTVHGADEVATP